MKRKIITTISTILLLVMIFSMNAGSVVFGSSGSGTVTVGKRQVFTRAVTGATRTTNYSYVNIRANSVFPVGNYSEDNYTRCQTRIGHNTFTNAYLSDQYVIKEGQGYYNIYLYEGVLGIATYDILFAGNNPNYDACIAYSYIGR